MLNVTMLKDREVSELINLAQDCGPVPPKQFKALVRHGFAAGGDEVDQYLLVAKADVLELEGLLMKRQALRQVRRARKCYVGVRTPSGNDVVYLPVPRQALVNMLEDQHPSEYLGCTSSYHWDAAHISDGCFYWG
jgi:hypothetical protein